MVHRERPEQAHLDHTHALPAGRQVFSHLVGALRARPHQDDDALGSRMADIVEQAIAPSGEGGEARHRLVQDVGEPRVEGLRRFSALEECIRVLGAAAEHRAVRVWRPGAMGPHGVLIQQGAQRRVIQRCDLADLVRGAKSVEEMQHRHARGQGGGVTYGGEVLRLLGRARGQKSQARAAHGHHVGMVAEDRQGMGREAAGGHVHAEGRQLARDLEQVGQHQQQPLRCGEGGRKRAGLQGAMHRAGRAALGLHFDDIGTPPQGWAAHRPTRRRHTRPSARPGLSDRWRQLRWRGRRHRPPPRWRPASYAPAPSSSRRPGIVEAQSWPLGLRRKGLRLGDRSHDETSTAKAMP